MKLIKNLNINGDNNDMIDVFEKYVDDIIFSGDLKLLVKSEITKLRKEVKNKNINLTQNEQEELRRLLIKVVNNNEISKNEKLEILVNLMNSKINNEIKELDQKNLKKPKELINLIKDNNNISKYGKIGETYLGKSDYVVVIFGVKHKKYNGNNLSNEALDLLINQDNNMISIIGELIKNGVSSVYSFESMEMKELSKGLFFGSEKYYIDIFKNYEKLLKNPKKNKEKIRNIENYIFNLGIDSFKSEFKFNEKILTYGVEDKLDIKLNLALTDFISFMKDKIEKDGDFLNMINKFLINRKKYYLNNGETKEDVELYINNLKNILIPSNYNKMSFGEYCNYIVEKNYYYIFKKRNESVVKNIEELNKNTKRNLIMLQFGADHFKKDIKTGIPEVDNVIIPSLKIKDIKTLLKEKGISFVEVTPFTEKK